MKNYVGVDISKTRLDVCYKGKSYSSENSAEGIDQFLKRLKKGPDAETMVIFEPTGGYERLLKTMLSQEGIAWHMAHANKVRALGKSMGRLAKTDNIDAKILVNYGELMKPSPSSINPHEKTVNLLKRRVQFIDAKRRETNLLDKDFDESIVESINKHVEFLTAEIGFIEKQLDLEAQCDRLKSKVNLLTSNPGIAQITALNIIAYMPEIEIANEKQLAALAGLAPMNRDSGASRGKRFVQGGRAELRAALYMAAVASIKHNNDISAFYQKLKSQGKPSKVAITAVLRKLLLLASSILRKGEPWRDLQKC